MNVAQAAQLLGVSERLVYDLAAPAGPIPCTRIGRRIIFDEADVAAYREAHRCRSAGTPATSGGVSSLTVASPTGDTALAAYFRKAGRAPRLTPSTGPRQPGSTPLRLVSSERGRARIPKPIKRGEDNGAAKLLDVDVRSIRRLLSVGLTQREIAERFGVSQQTIAGIKAGKRWGHVK